MPELPEVQTTVNGIKSHLKGLRITDVWTDYGSSFHDGKPNIKNKRYFAAFKKYVVGKTVEDASRIGKNVLVHLSDGVTIVIHMKMTGHLLYGEYAKKGGAWVAAKPGPLRDDPFNRFVRLVFTLGNGKHLALCDLRRFAKVHALETKSLFTDKEIKAVGPDPLSPAFTYDKFEEALAKRPNAKIKQVLMDPSVVAGIGNIYSDEMLWRAGVHPLSAAGKIPERETVRMYEAAKEVLSRGIDFGGDSMSDYRNILGEPGKFQSKHEAYRRTGEKCRKRGCGGTIRRLKLGGRSAHFCDRHQKAFS